MFKASFLLCQTANSLQSNVSLKFTKTSYIKILVGNTVKFVPVDLLTTAMFAWDVHKCYKLFGDRMLHTETQLGKTTQYYDG